MQLSPNFALGHYTLAFVHSQSGDAEAAIGFSDHSRSLSPFDPFNYFFLVGAGLAEFIAGRYDEAIGWLRKTIRANPRFLPGHRHLVTALANAGRDEEAHAGHATGGSR